MALETGRVVRSLAGRDKGLFLVVVASDERDCYLADGKERPLEHPKRKRIKHVAVTNTVFMQGSMETNRQLRRALLPFGKSGREHL